MDEKVEGYLKILYPEQDILNQKELNILEIKKLFIVENIDEIEKRYKQAKKVEENEDEEAKKEKIELEENKQKDDMQGETAKDLNEQQEVKKEENEEENIEESTEKNESSELDNHLKDKELLNNIIREIKVDKYFAILHPDYETLEEEEQYYVFDDKIIIMDCIDAIDAYYQDCKAPGSGAREMEWTDQMIIESALQLFNKQEKIFTPDDIEKFSNTVKYAEFKEAITAIKNIASEEQEESSKE